MALLEYNNLTVIRKNGELPHLPYKEIATEILGAEYTLTIIFCTPEESRDRNATYRNKDYATNILSFPLGDNEGEIYISLSIARRDAKKFNLSYREFLHLLLVHGCLHLKGYDHGSTMEELEQTYFKKFFRDSK
jgi:probable rRNA maturation factor